MFDFRTNNKVKLNLGEIQTYEDYLDQHITPQELFYLGDQDMARELYENGICKDKEFLSRTQFEEVKQKRRIGGLSLRRKKKKKEKICSIGKDLRDYPLLFALAKREKLVRDGKLSTIIFIRDNVNGEEVSGYIDFGERLKTEDFEVYFSKKKTLLPKPTDLSYYNWRTRVLKYNESSTFSILTQQNHLVFKHKRDRKTIDIDPTNLNNPKRKPIETDEYVQCVLYEHNPRRKTRE